MSTIKEQLTFGVALIVENTSGQLLLLQEFESKPHLGKYPGMYSIPMETSNQNENDEAALDRLIKEEMPGMAGVLSFKKERVGWYQVVSKTWVTLYATKTSSTWLPANTPEVGNYVWLNPVEALNLWLRQGAREMIVDFHHARKWVVCTRCQPPPSAPIQSAHYKTGPA